VSADDIEAIKQLKARYFRCMDTKDWAGFAQVFADDALMDMSGEMRDAQTEGSGITRGGQAIADFVRGSVDPVTTVHHGHTPEITLTSPTTATGIWAMEDKLRWPDGAPIRTLHGYGHYHETYTRTAAGWRIQTTTLTRLRIDVEMA
jgi:SnoaL-like domain